MLSSLMGLRIRISDGHAGGKDFKEQLLAVARGERPYPYRPPYFIPGPENGETWVDQLHGLMTVNSVTYRELRERYAG